MLRKRLGMLVVLLIGILLAVNTLGCKGQQVKSKYPSKPIELIVPFAPGGATDVVARPLALRLQEMWGQTVTVVNKPGGSGTVGVMEVVGAAPDGYKMLVNVTSTGSLNPAVDPNLPYKWDQLTHVCRINVNPLVFIVKGDSKWNGLQDVVNELKADPTKYNYGTSGAGGPSTFAIAQLCQDSGIDPTKLTRVVLGGGAAVVTAVAGGHVHLAAQNLSEVVAMIEAGKIKALAVTTPERAPQLPNVPTTKEAGFPGVTLVGWNGISGPPGLPADVVKAWEEAVQKVCADPGFQKEMEKAGATAAFLNQADFQKFLKEYYETGVAIAEKLGLRK